MTEQILWTASITPFTQDGIEVDYPSLERCLRAQESAKNGILLLGSTGESLSLRAKEKRQIIDYAVSLNLKVPLMVGIAGYDLDEALALLHYTQELPIHGYLMTTPIYTKPGALGQTAWFETLLNKAAHPVMLYNIPGRAAVTLHAETVKNLQQHEKFVAIKDSSGTIESIVEYKIAAPDIAVFCGDDYMAPSMAAEGAVGLVSIAANAWPVATRHYAEQALSGDPMSSKIWWQATKALFSASNPVPIKALMKDTQMITYDTVRLPLSLLDLPSRKTLLDYHKIIQNWRRK